MNKKPDPLHILLVYRDDGQAALKAVTSFNIVMDACQTQKEALTKIQTNNYDAFIISSVLKEGVGLDIVLEAQKKKVPVAVLTDLNQEEHNNFRLLKEKYKVDYVLDRPVYHDRFERLYTVLCNRNRDRLSKNLKDKKQELRDYYNKTICDKVELLTDLVNRVIRYQDEPSLTALKEAVHKFGGSAGAYGFRDASKIFKELEYEIREKLNPESKASLFNWLQNMNEFLIAIKFYLQFADDDTEISKNDLDYRNLLFIADSDEKFLELLQKEKTHFPIDLITETNPIQAEKMISAPDFNPRAVLVANSFPGFSLNGLQIIQSMKNKPDFLPTVFAISIEEEDLDRRIEASKEGIQHIFTKPISPHILFETFAKEITPPQLESFRVLILDDDEDTSHFMSVALSEIGITSREIHKPNSLYQTLEEFIPDLLLLDILLPQYDGINLLKTLRADPVYSNLDVIVVTNFEDPFVKKTVHGENVTHILNKPLNKATFQNLILEVAKQHRLSNKVNLLNKRIGLKTRSDLKNLLEEIILKKEDTKKYLSFIEIENFESFVVKKGRSFVNKFLTSFGNMLTSKVGRKMEPFFLGSSRFALLTEGIAQEALEEKIRAILLDVKSENDIYLVVGILEITKNFHHVNDILKNTEKALGSAKQTNAPSFIKLKFLKEGSKEAEKKEVFFIDPDASLQKMIKKGLEQFHLKVTIFSNGKEALEGFISRKTDLPSLIISERKLPDMDGLDLLDKVKAQSRVNTPFYFLTNFVSDQDIETGLRHGAADYITKPFNLSIFIQKILLEIFEKTPAR